MANRCPFSSCCEDRPCDAKVHEKGLNNIIKTSEKLKDGFKDIVKKIELPIWVHKSCRALYINPRKLQQQKRKHEGDEVTPRKKTRTEDLSDFDIKKNCLFCGDKLPKYSNSNYLPGTSGQFETIEAFSSIQKIALARNDKWGHEVHVRIQNIGDLVAAEAKYHISCKRRFSLSKTPDKTEKKGRPSGSIDPHKVKAYAKLREHIDSHENTQTQYSLTELYELMESFSEENCVYGKLHFKTMLKSDYGSNMYISNENGKETIYTFLDAGNQILRDNFASSGLTAENVIDWAAVLIEDEIRSTHYDLSHYPDFSQMNDPNLVSPLLMRILKKMIKSETKQCSIAHSVTAAARPRSYISPILLAVSLYVNTKYESRLLIDILNKLGFADDYREVERFHDAVLPRDGDVVEYDWEGSFIQFIIDNADCNTRTLTGHGTWHSLGAVAGVTPAKKKSLNNIQRSTKVRPASVRGKFSEIDIKKYIKPKTLGLKKIFIGPLQPQKPSNLNQTINIDNIWLSSFYIAEPDKGCPSWSGFNQTVIVGDDYDISSLDILPFINNDPNDLDTLYSSLVFLQELSVKYNLGLCPVTADQPLYIKISEIILSSPNLSKVFARLGGFHLLCSYMGSIGNIMKGSGLESLWQTVFAKNSTDPMMNGKAYARAVKAHLLSAAALTTYILETPGCLSGVNINKLRGIHSMLLTGNCCIESLTNEFVIQQMSQILEDLSNDLSEQSRTGKLWIQYIQMVRLIMLFLRAERAGYWDLHLYAIELMIPYFHAAGHIKYARCARLYIEQMKRLKDIMSAEEYTNYTTNGYFTLRRKDRKWAGIFSDLTIEQDLMKMLKTNGGITRGRGITQSTQSTIIHALPKTIPVCSSLEEFCDVKSITNEQHVDMRKTSCKRDTSYIDIFLTFLRSHSPFAYAGEHQLSLVCIATGVVAAATANADQAKELGECAAMSIVNQNYADVKLKRNDKVVSISASLNSVEVRGENVQVNPTLLFLRINCVLKDKTEMREYLKYEFSTQPTSLFKDNMMRKNTKSDLAAIIKPLTTPCSSLELDNPFYILDGGHLLRHFPWPTHYKQVTYDELCDMVIAHVIKHYGNNVVPIFDGYRNPWSTKTAEQKRRAMKNVSANILFSPNDKISCDLTSFLSNSFNKARLIDMLIDKFKEAEIECYQSLDDADYMIVATTIRKSIDHPEKSVITVANDTDILVLLIHHTQNRNVYMHYSQDEVFNIMNIKDELTPQVNKHILVLHAVSGCDTTSSVYGIGKSTAYTVFNSDINWDFLNIFQDEHASHEAISAAGETLMLHLFKSKKCKSLDKLRYLSYMNKVAKKSLTSRFELQSLPPTSTGAKYHSFRVYLTIQQWLGFVLDACLWGWKKKGDMLIPIPMDIAVAPENILKIISCGCKTTCGNRCGCRKNVGYCSPMCSPCNGQTCTNTEILNDDAS